ncbi:MAG: GNAT family N-acetyltransferase [Myxococcales bacterium]|nr:GNAT family N-acetyltransferase [Myxococcales bacterium]
MDLTWTPEPSAAWDADKRHVVGAWTGVFPALQAAHDGAVLPGHWWRAELDGATVGYGWMDVTWGDAEVLLAVHPKAVGKGVGSFVLDKLVHEARKQGLRYMYNVVPTGHPSPSTLQAWLEKRGFGLSGDGLLKRQI